MREQGLAAVVKAPYFRELLSALRSPVLGPFLLEVDALMTSDLMSLRNLIPAEDAHCLYQNCAVLMYDCRDYCSQLNSTGLTARLIGDGDKERSILRSARLPEQL